jgi:hypothetical protein
MEQVESEISLPRARRVYEYICMNLAEHEKECCVCSSWLKQNEDIRCAEYREIQIRRDIWHSLERMLVWEQQIEEKQHG